MLFNIDLIIMFIIRNIICFIPEVKNITSLAKRSSMICIINFVLLALKEYINIVAN